jgi:GT2 family glycosyltransferase
MLKASVLVVSRTPELLNRLLRSLNQAYSGNADSIEVIASWNGSAEDEARLQPGRLPFRIAQHDPYHFASNMNGLARKANGAALIFANDDLIVDPGSVDAALARLEARPEVGLIGARLRTSNRQLAHAGIHFTSYGSPYHQLEHFVDADHPTNERERVVPAVTGAFFAMRRNEFLQLELAETFNVCGEDVLLCLQTRSILQKQILFCPAMSGVHDAESTRSQFEEQQGHDDDMKRMRSGWRELIQCASKESLQMELQAAQDEAEDLRGRCLELLAQNAEQEVTLTGLRTKAAAQAMLQAQNTQQQLQHSLLESENKRLRSRVQQLENQLRRLEPTSRSA